MRVFVLDMKKYKGFWGIFKSILIVVLVCALITWGFETYLVSDDYVSAMHLESEKKTVIIDAGHGGEDGGTSGKNGVLEKDLNLSIAFELGSQLEKEGYAIIYTRVEDKLLYTEEENIKGIRKISDLKNRCKIAAEYPNAIFISIHMNSYSSPKYSGLQVYYSTNNPQSKMMAASVQGAVKNNLQPENSRKIKAGNGIYVLENTDNVSILIECGFLSNQAECEKLSEKEYQKSLCFSIVCGIIEYNQTN